MKKNAIKGGMILESVPLKQQDKKDQKIGAVLCLFAGALLLIALCGTILSLLSLGAYHIVLGIWSVVCVGLCLVFRKVPKYRVFLAIGGGVFLLAVVLLGGEIFRDGLGLFFNGVKDLFGTAYGRIYLPFEVSGTHNDALCLTIFMLPITLMFSVIVTYALTSEGRAVPLLLLSCLLFALIPTVNSPFWVWYTLLSFSFMILIIVRISGIVKNGGHGVLPLAGGVTALILCGLCLLPLALENGYEKPRFAASAEVSAFEFADSILWRRDATHNLPEGQFENLTSLVRNDKTALEVTMSELSSLYLRGYVGTVYTGSGWEQTEKETLYEYADLFYWLHQGGFYGTSQLALAADAAGAETTDISVSVKNVNANDRYIYSPYEYRDGAAGDAPFRIGDTAPSPADHEDNREFSYTMSSNLVRDPVSVAVAIDEKASRGDETALSYLECENAYREYVYAEHLNIPKDVKTILESHFGEADLSEGHEDYDKVMQEILNKLLTSTTYNENTGELGADNEVVRYFLETGTEGYSVHYATAAAMIFRYYGIPARYVEGFVITPENLFGLNDGDTVALTGENAHAWVEYYRDGVGWIPFEVTPPYLFIMELPEQMKSYVSSNLDALSNQSGMLNMEEDNFEDAEDEEETEKDKKDSFAWWQILLMIIGILLFLALCGVIALMARRHLALRRRKEAIGSADDRDAVDMLLCDCLEILFAVGLKRKNGSMEEYAEPLNEMGDPVLGDLFKMMIELHREAMFSDHGITPNRRYVFSLFRKAVIDFAEKRSGLKQRLIHRYIRNLY